MAVIEVKNWRERGERRKRRLAAEATEAKREQVRQMERDRLRRILEGNWPPSGGDAA